MGQAYDALNQDQRNNFDARLKQLGLTPDVVQHAPLRTTGATYLSSDPNVASAHPPTFIQVDSLDDLKRLVGIPDADYDNGIFTEHHEIPEPWPADRLVTVTSDLTVAERRQIFNAGRAYVFGRSSLVASYKPIIEKLFMPVTLAVFSGDSITVTPGNPLIFSGPNPVIANYGQITIEQGGQVQVDVETHVTVQILQEVAAS
jgi:hypothetical protein